MLYYLPLEPYAERYTALMSCKNGWAENHFKKLGVDFQRIDGISWEQLQLKMELFLMLAEEVILQCLRL